MVRVLVALSCVFLGCKGDKKPSPEVTAPKGPTLELTGDKLRCSDGSCEGTISDSLAVVLLKAKNGTKVTAAGRTGPPATEGAAVAIADAKNLVAKANLVDIMTKGMPLDVAVEFPDGAKITSTVQVPAETMTKAVDVLLRKVNDGGLMLDGETAETKPGSALFYAISPPQILGDAKSIRDIGRVALLETDTREKKCGKYQSDDGMTGGTYEIRMVDATITVHDRITGRLVGKKKKFPAVGKPECPKSFRAEWGGAFSEQLNFDDKAVFAWLRDVQSGAVQP